MSLKEVMIRICAGEEYGSLSKDDRLLAYTKYVEATLSWKGIIRILICSVVLFVLLLSWWIIISMFVGIVSDLMRQICAYAVSLVIAGCFAVIYMILNKRILIQAMNEAIKTKSWCTRCGYELTGLKNDKCPECGHESVNILTNQP